MLTASQFLILNGVVVTLLLVYFFVGRGKTAPSRLNFSKNNNSTKNLPLPVDDTSGAVLNVMFNYNGHSFDAYEVLGVPAGSTWDEIQQIYQKNSRQLADPTSQEFFKVALEAIRLHLKNAANNTPQ